MATTVVQENEGSREPDVGAVLSRTIREALSRYPPISDVVIASNECSAGWPCLPSPR